MTLRTAIVGFGRIAAGYADDPVMARTYRYVSHVQVLADHPAFACIAAVDPSSEARDLAARRWNVPYTAASVAEIPRAEDIEVAVIATPPAGRAAVLDALPSLKAVVVEKPLGANLDEAARFLAACRARNILVQVNLWRRADATFRALAAGLLQRHVGTPQAAAVVYGNGVANNAIHLIDAVSMLLGRVVRVQAVAQPARRATNPIAGDPDLSFVASTAGGATVYFMPVDFGHYRENAIDIWGTQGRFEALVEGLVMRATARQPHRGDGHASEIAADAPVTIASTVGEALWHLYDNLVEALAGRAELFSPGENALRAQSAVEAALRSAANACRPVELDAAA